VYRFLAIRINSIEHLLPNFGNSSILASIQCQTVLEYVCIPEDRKGGSLTYQQIYGGQNQIEITVIHENNRKCNEQWTL
jgi:hypothetical protein